MLKRITSLFLSITIAFSGVVFAGGEAFASGEDLNSTIGVYYTNCRYSRADLSDAVYYSDSPFMKDSKEFNNDLAIMSLELAVSSNPSMREPETIEGYYNKCRNIQSYLEDNGFVDFETNGDYRIKMTETTLGVACAHKNIVDDGKKYTLLVLAPRSAGYEAEWMSNFIISSSADAKGNHAGYEEAANKVMAYAREYIKKYGIKGNIKLWLTGYSRGGGIADFAGAAVLADSSRQLGNEVSLTPDNFYCYAFGSPRTIAAEGNSFDFSKTDYVHNLYRDSDLMTNLPPETMGFVRYGRHYEFAQDYSAERRENMLKHLNEFNSQFYNDYINGKDPDAFRNMKIDTKALRKLKFELVEDTESYHQADQAEFLDSMARTVNEVSARASESGNSREGFYNEYQYTLGKLISYIMDHPENVSLLGAGIKESKTLIPMAVSLYIMYMTDRNSNIASSDMNELLESSFNQMAAVMEDENGELKNEYKEFKAAYKLVKAFYKESENTGDTEGKYVLRKNVQYNRLMGKQIRELTGLLYAATLRDGLKSMNADEDVIEKFTSRKDRNACSYMLANLALGDVYQSQTIHRFSFNSEEFKHLATFAGNVSKLMTNHYNDIMMSWMKTEDSRYDSIDPAEYAKLGGYRRVYLGSSAGNAVRGSVIDSDGTSLAEFKADKLTARTDKRIGITTSDSGSWLRLPADKDLKVIFTTDASSKLDIRAADYSYYKGEVIRTVNKDSRYKWKGIAASKGDRFTISIPAAELKGDEYDLTAPAYTLDITRASGSVQYDKSIPKPKNVKLKAAKKAALVSWKKLSAKKLAKFSHVEIQFSKSKAFSGSSVKSRTVSNKKASCRIKGLKKGTYYFRLRNIKYIYGTKKASKWVSGGKIRI